MGSVTALTMLVDDQGGGADDGKWQAEKKLLANTPLGFLGVKLPKDCPKCEKGGTYFSLAKRFRIKQK